MYSLVDSCTIPPNGGLDQGGAATGFLKSDLQLDINSFGPKLIEKESDE